MEEILEKIDKIVKDLNYLILMMYIKKGYNYGTFEIS